VIDFANVALTERRTPPQWPSDDAPFPAGLAALKVALDKPENAQFKEMISRHAAKLIQEQAQDAAIMRIIEEERAKVTPAFLGIPHPMYPPEQP
jgi:hypothetical protein